MFSRRTHQASRSGSSLIYALLILLLIFTVVSAFLSLVALQQTVLAREHKAAVARNLAEGGLHLAAAKLARTPTYRGESGVPLGDGAFDVKVEPRGNGWEITATGHVPVLGEAQLQRTVRARAFRRGGRVRLGSWQELPSEGVAPKP